MNPWALRPARSRVRRVRRISRVSSSPRRKATQASPNHNEAEDPHDSDQNPCACRSRSVHDRGLLDLVPYKDILIAWSLGRSAFQAVDVQLDEHPGRASHVGVAVAKASRVALEGHRRSGAKGSSPSETHDDFAMTTVDGHIAVRGIARAFLVVDSAKGHSADARSRDGDRVGIPTAAVGRARRSSGLVCNRRGRRPE